MTSPCPPPSALTVLAPAKINLILRILDRRPDGFHNLWSVMQTVALHDEIAIGLNQSHTEIRLHCDTHFLSADHTNLVYRAAVAVLQKSARTTGLDITLRKRIPMGAGLGGGSSDAAATIVGLNQLLGLGWSQADMAAVGETLGSDVPFFFFAPSALVSGRGEHVKGIRMLGGRWVVLVNPGFPVETKWAYQQLSATRSFVEPVPSVLAAVEHATCLTWAEVIKEAHNDFERPVFSANSLLRDLKASLLAEGAEAALLSGSGATVFGIYESEGRAKAAALRFQADPALKVFAVPAESRPLQFAP